MKCASLIAIPVLIGALVWAQSVPAVAPLHIIPQPGSPAVLRAARTGGALRVMLRNRSGKTIIAYRLGWFDEAGKPTIGEHVPLAIAKRGTGPLRSRAFLMYPNARFFLAELAFGDGTGWKADVNALRREVTKPPPSTAPV